EARAELEDVGSVVVRLGLRDAHCAATEVEIEMFVSPGESDECPSIQILNATFDAELPSPCRGNAYLEGLSAEGGVEPYEWRELSAPPGLHFDAETEELSGVAEGDGVLELQLTDADGRSVERSYSVQTRDKCWLAYIANEP